MELKEILLFVIYWMILIKIKVNTIQKCVKLGDFNIKI